ncbi:G protein-activated inward rectifier potassium channel 3-like [Agrilus planipennis]|uniref:G protein-activated inward rectifier potassium channel 3-like n=1 Tax=Agrilus planipennis TaxID=224129 RepID=A0A1W4WSS2_AGRPL|nr:G protein-activated inward rectifier potassium channel 3-like [Agrilus planipennis]
MLNPFPQENRGISRLIHSTGKYNVSKNQTPEFWIAHIRDFSHTLVESSWKWILLAFISSYILCWLLFAWFYELVAIANGDHDGNYTSSKPCLEGIHSFTGYYLFSLETQHTTGFGSRVITDNCVEGVFILSMQVILGSAICGGMATLVYTKMVKPESLNAPLD